MHLANSERAQYKPSQQSYECGHLGLLRSSENSTLAHTRMDNSRVRRVAITGNYRPATICPAKVWWHPPRGGETPHSVEWS
jgi:hypothetical protein